jgi:hypothetical protein
MDILFHKSITNDVILPPVDMAALPTVKVPEVPLKLPVPPKICTHSHFSHMGQVLLGRQMRTKRSKAASHAVLYASSGLTWQRPCLLVVPKMLDAIGAVGGALWNFPGDGGL